MSLIGVFSYTIATVIHLAHQDLHGGVAALGLLERVLEPPLRAVRDDPGERDPTLALGALHPQPDSLRVDPETIIQFRGLRRRNSDLRHLARAVRSRELVGSNDSGQLLESGR